MQRIRKIRWAFIERVRSAAQAASKREQRTRQPNNANVSDLCCPLHCYWESHDFFFLRAIEMDQNIIQVYEANDSTGQVMTILQPQQASIYTTVTSAGDEITSKSIDLTENTIETTIITSEPDPINATSTTATTTNTAHEPICELTTANNQHVVDLKPDNLVELGNHSSMDKITGEGQIASSNGKSNSSNNNNRLSTRFKWTKEKSQVAMNLVKHGCKPKLVSVAVGCSLRTAQKFVETVTPKMEGESFKNYVIRRRGRKSKDVNERLEAIREVLSRDSTKTQVEIAADLKVSNTTVCRDLKKIKGNSSTKAPRSKQHSTKNAPSSR